MLSRYDTHWRGHSRIISTLVVVCFSLMMASSSFAQVGHTLSGVGAVDQSWSGAGTANPQDFMSALYWNPGSITRFDGTRVALGIQFLMPTSDLNSSVDAGAFGPQFGPPVDMAGLTESEAGPFPIPAVGFVKNLRDSPITYGISTFGVGGFGTDYALGTNPINSPQAPNGMGFGAIYSEFSLLQVSPTVAYRLSDQFSIGISPTINYAMLEVSPFPAGIPDDANGDGFPTYSSVPRTGTFGVGLHAGLYFESDTGISLGASFKSKQNFSDFEFDAVDELGADKSIKFGLDYPMMISGGVGYTSGRFAAAADVRYIDYENTKGFDKTGYNQFGAVQGFGWNSIMVVAVGVQYEVVDGLPVRLGYSYNESPIADENIFFNTPANAIIMKRLSGGFSYNLSESLVGSLGVQYGFENKCAGNWVVPQGSVTGTTIESSLQTFFVMFGIDYRIN